LSRGGTRKKKIDQSQNPEGRDSWGGLIRKRGGNGKKLGYFPKKKSTPSWGGEKDWPQANPPWSKDIEEKPSFNKKRPAAVPGSIP